MQERQLTLPELMLVAGTRAVLGAGVALLLTDRVGRKQRRAAGWALFVVGVATTVPLAMLVFGRRQGQPGGPGRQASQAG
jgi:hypothetical protein